jgi:methyltransferase
MIPALLLVVVLASMLIELAVSRSNERVLRGTGAVDARDPAYAVMRWAYPAVFVVMCGEGWLREARFGPAAEIGTLVFVAAKAFKAWAIAALGRRWTYKVLVVPGAPLVRGGPYRFMRHPNYAGVVGELIGVALIADARVSGPLAALFFVWLLRVRIAAEERALGFVAPASPPS